MLRVTYQRVESDLPNGSMHFDEPETLDLVKFDAVEPRENHGVRLEGVDSDGRDVVVFAGGRVNIRGPDETGSYSFLGYARKLTGVAR
jgi:hypothetical protein